MRRVGIIGKTRQRQIHQTVIAAHAVVVVVVVVVVHLLEGTHDIPS
jgi:hypothetical protein